MPRVTWTAASLTAILLLAGCAAPEEPDIEPESVQGGAGTGGGTVSDAPPVVPAFAGSLTTADNSGSSVEVFTGRVFDANGERDLRDAVLRVAITGGVTATATHTIATGESTATTEPASYGGDGFKVWSGTNNDGVIEFRFRYTFGLGVAAGLYTFTPSVTPSGASAVTGTPDTTTVSVFSEITVAPTPVTGTGTGSDAAWGGWDALPGATNVESVNYLQLNNTGQRTDASVVIDFTQSAFSGADGNFTIPITSNLEFAWWEDTTPSSTRPDEGTYTYLSASADGSVTVSFSGLGNVIYVKYRIKTLPSVLAGQTYAASFTATEL